jgi:hypothetical protein
VERLEAYRLLAGTVGDLPIVRAAGSATTTTTLTSSENPATVGETVTITAVVGTASAGGTPTGFVQFYGGSSPVLDPILLPLVDMAGQSEATLSFTGIEAGTETIHAQYKGDSNFLGSSAAPLAQVFNPVPPAITLSAMPNPAVAGQGVAFTASVMPTTGTGTPTGSVTFSIDGTPQTPLALSVAGGQDMATFSDPGLGIGTHTITASYSGDSNFGPAATMPLTVTVNPSATFRPSPTTPTSNTTQASTSTQTQSQTSAPATTPAAANTTTTTTTLSLPPQPPMIAAVQQLRTGLTSISLDFGEALNPDSAIKAHAYLMLGAVQKHATTVFRKKVDIRSIRYDDNLQTVTITLAKPQKGALQVTVQPGLMAANGASSSTPFSIVVK